MKGLMGTKGKMDGRRAEFMKSVALAHLMDLINTAVWSRGISVTQNMKI